MESHIPVPAHAVPFVAALSTAVAGDAAFDAVLLAGSAISGEFDEWSDLDVVLVCGERDYDRVLRERRTFAASLGGLLAAFTGEHVGEPRLLICLFDAPLLHVDLKFVTADALAHRVENPRLLWARDATVAARLASCMAASPAQWPNREPAWFEERAWIWLHYGLAKVGRGERYEALGMLAYFREQVLGPLLATVSGRDQRGLRRIEDVAAAASGFDATLGGLERQALLAAYAAAAALYVDLRHRAGIAPNAAAQRAVEAFMVRVAASPAD